MPRPAVFIAWKPECHRSTMTARAFGLQLWLIAPFAGRQTWRIVLRYLAAALLTAGLLLARRPRTVFILNQPLPLVVVALAWCGLSGARLVLDSHSKPFGPGQPRLARAFYRHAARRAWFNINHNREDAAVVTAMGARIVLIPEIAGPLAFAPDPAVSPVLPAVLAVCSFARDEPVALLLAVARRLPDIRFYVTGNWRKSPEMAGPLPANVVPLGFVSRETYLTYASKVSAVLTLSTRDNIMQMAAEEALCLGTPIVTNHSPILEEVFTRGAAFARLDEDDLAAAIAATVADQPAMVAAIRQLAAESSARLHERIADVLADDPSASR